MIESSLIRHASSNILGDWHSTPNARKLSVFNPANNELLAEVELLTPDEVSRAVDYAATTLATVSGIQQRTAWLEKIAELLLENKRELGRIITLENGKPWPEAIGEVEYAASFFSHYAGNIDQIASKEITETPRNCRWTIHYRPAGVAALITPWNFPLAMFAKKFSAALAAGCPAICKPSNETPLSLIAFFELLKDVSLPGGTANLVIGPAKEIGEILCTHPAIRVISFTGSTNVGRKLAELAAPHLKRLSLELGGNAPFIVFDDANIPQAVEALVSNKFRGAGQTCVCTNRVYLQKNIAEEFRTELLKKISDMKVGYGINDNVDMGPLINSSAKEKVQEHVADAVSKGASQLDSGADQTTTGENFLLPVILDQATHEMQCVREETFGPVIPLITFQSEEEVVSMANDTDYGLAAYLFTEDMGTAERVIRQIHFGHVGLNTATGPAAEAPFGGMKQSGYGREGGAEGLHEFVEPQTVPTPIE